MALLRPGRCGFCPQGGCLQHRTEAQRRPKEQVCGRDARAPRAITPPLRGSRRSRAARRRLMRWGVSGGRLLRKPTCTLWETPVCPRAGRPPCRADHSRKNGPSLMKTNHEWTRRNTKTDGPASTTSGAKMRLQFCALGVTSCPWWISFFPQCLSSWPFTDPFRVFSNPLESLRGLIYYLLNRYSNALRGNLFPLPDLWRIPLEPSPTP